MSDVEVFLDQMPGETRGIVARNGHFHHLIIQRDSDRPTDRLGAVCVGRVARVEPALRAAFVDLGQGEPFGFLPLGKNAQMGEGTKLEVEVIAEPRERKGPVLKRLADATGEPRLIEAGPDVPAILARLAPGCPAEAGLVAARVAVEAEEDALGIGVTDPSIGLDLAIQRTRALIAVDIDHSPMPGRDGRRGREAANRVGLLHTARLMSLKSWGGLLVIDLVGFGLHGETMMKGVRAAFAGEPQASFAPLSRFGIVQISLPWRRTPVEERLLDAQGRPSLETRALAVVRQLRTALLSDTASPRLIAHCDPQAAAIASNLISGLGPRAGIFADESVLAGVSIIKEA